MRAPPTAVAETLANRYALPLATAREDVNRALALDAGAAALDALDGPYLYARSPGGYSFLATGFRCCSSRTKPAPFSRRTGTGSPPGLADDPAGDRARRCHCAVIWCCRSAVVLNQSIVAFAGKSGAGKTTTGRVFAAAGAQLLCEDKLLLRDTAGAFEAIVDGERRILRWVASAAAELSAGRPARCDMLDMPPPGLTADGGDGFLDMARRFWQSKTRPGADRTQATRAIPTRFMAPNGPRIGDGISQSPPMRPATSRSTSSRRPTA